MLNGGPCLSQRLGSLSFMDTTETLGVLVQQEATGSTIVLHQAIPGQLINRADFIVRLFAEQFVQVFACVLPFAQLAGCCFAWAPVGRVLPGEGARLGRLFVAGCIMTLLTRLIWLVLLAWYPAADDGELTETESASR